MIISLLAFFSCTKPGGDSINSLEEFKEVFLLINFSPWQKSGSYFGHIDE